MTLVQLEYILAVDTHRHFARAAEACYITQPTLSMQIHKLEDALGIMIFDRSKQPVVPTEIGRLIIEQARVIVNESRKISEIIQDQKDEISGEIRMGIIPTVAPYLLPLFITQFIAKYPNVHISVEELVTAEIMQKLKQDQLDLGILVTPSKEQGIQEEPLYYEAFTAYVAEDHPLYHKSSINTEDLEQEGIWLLNEGHCFRNQVMQLCNKSQSSSNGLAYQSGSLEALRKIVDMYHGFTLLPELATLDLSKTALKKVRKFNEPVPTREVSLVMHRSFLKQKIVKALKSEIMAALPVEIRERKEPAVIDW